MDFIHGFPKNKQVSDSILTFVHRFSKILIYFPCNSDVSAIQVAHLFHHHIFRCCGLSDFIVSDGDQLLTSKLWAELMKILGVKLKISTECHQQTNGQAEVMNRIIE